MATTPSTEVAVQEAAQLPALAPTPAAFGGITASDVSLPKLYRGEYQSALVQDDVVPKGCIFVASGPDDPEPNVVWEQPAKGKTPGDDDGVLVHIVDLIKGKSIQVDGDLQTFAYDDPDAPADAWVTFTYVVVMPEVDAEIPVKLLMTKTSAPTAKRINFLLLKNQGKQPYELAFRLTLKPREKTANGQTYKWFVWQARQVEADPKNVEIGAAASQLVGAGQPRNNIERTASEPAI